ncbi:MAG: flavodoxin domain-containing protein [Dehalococcoidia bacterium]
MAGILILFGTGEGQTRKVANRISRVVQEKGHEAMVVQGNKAPEDFSAAGFDAAFVGTSIHMGLHQLSVRRLVRDNIESFNRIPTAYFCVCLHACGKKEKDRKQAQAYIDDFNKYTGLQPRKMAVFAGALRYPYYNFVKRYVAKLVARRVGADTDTRQEYYEYTDWEAVDAFAVEFLESIE